MEEVIAWLLQAISNPDGSLVFQVVTEPVRMTLDACVELANVHASC